MVVSYFGTWDCRGGLPRRSAPAPPRRADPNLSTPRGEVDARSARVRPRDLVESLRSPPVVEPGPERLVSGAMSLLRALRPASLALLLACASTPPPPPAPPAPIAASRPFGSRP